jgi:hypothetical protein
MEGHLQNVNNNKIWFMGGSEKLILFDYISFIVHNAGNQMHIDLIQEFT